MKTMHRLLGATALCSAFGFASVCLAAESSSSTSPMQMSSSECTNLWQQANPSNSKGLTESQAKGYVTDFKAVNPDGDTTIDQTEWMNACNKGLITNTSSSGASGGASGKTSDRTPGEAAPARTPGSTSAGAPGAEVGQTPEGTSDRTPSK
jgi:hypothetical protein